jgi:thiamine biosynthesis lipoprotein
MGSTAEVVVFGPQPDELAARAVTEIERLEASWSRFRPGSELCLLNRGADRPAVVSTTLWAPIAAAARAWTETGGIFDPTILGTLQALGYDRTFAELPADLGPGPHPALVVGFGEVGLDPDRREVTLPAGVGLDLGGIGKGLAADLVVDELVRRGARSVAVSLGGDVRVGGEGPHGDGAWHVPVVRPTDEAVLGTFPLVDEALVQSTVCYRTWRGADRQLHHLIDPRTGWPAETGLAAVVVTGPDAARSEAFAKAALIAGPVDGPALVDGAGLDGWFIATDGTVTGTPRVAADLGAVGHSSAPTSLLASRPPSLLAGAESS